MLRLKLVLRGIKRSQGESIRVRLPITVHHLKLFHMMLAIPTATNFDSIMFWAAMTLAFFGFLRLGELTCNSKFNPETHLKPDDVNFSSESQPINGMFVRIKESFSSRANHNHWKFQHTSLPCVSYGKLFSTSANNISRTPLCKFIGKTSYETGTNAQDSAIAFSSGLSSLKFRWSQLSNWRCNYSSLGKTAFVAHQNSGPLVLGLL